jgi:hypothetical protein
VENIAHDPDFDRDDRKQSNSLNLCREVVTKKIREMKKVLRREFPTIPQLLALTHFSEIPGISIENSAAYLQVGILLFENQWYVLLKTYTVCIVSNHTMIALKKKQIFLIYKEI